MVGNAAPGFSLQLLLLEQSAFSTGGLLATLVPVSKHSESFYWMLRRSVKWPGREPAWRDSKMTLKEVRKEMSKSGVRQT